MMFSVSQYTGDEHPKRCTGLIRDFFIIIYSPSFSVYHLQSLRGSKLHSVQWFCNILLQNEFCNILLHSVTESLHIHFYENALGSVTTPWMTINWLNYEKVKCCFCLQGTFYMLRANEGNCSLSWTILVLKVSM